MPLLKNLVVIGQGAPNQLKDKRQSKCVCAFSLDTREFIRIYPVPLGWLRKWEVFEVEVEKNPSDGRENTWKIKNSKEDWKKLDKWIKVNGEIAINERKKLIQSFKVSTLGELIDNKKSFGIVKPKIIDFHLVQRREATVKQTTLVGSSQEDLDEGFCIINQHDYKYKPYIKFECIGNCTCKNKIHDDQITEWGCYEFMRKNPGKEEELKNNLRLFDNDWEIYLLMGNIHKAPQTYIIIDVLRFKIK